MSTPRWSRVITLGAAVALAAAPGSTQPQFFRVYDDVPMPAASAVETPSRGFAVAGGDASSSFLFAVDAAGDPVFLRHYDLPSAQALILAPSGFVLAGGSAASGSWVMRVDDAGAVLWARGLSSGAGVIRDIQATSDGGFLAAGEGTVKLDGAGRVQWSRNHFARPGSGYGVEAVPGGAFVTGEQIWPPVAGFEVVLLRLDNGGAVQWNRTFENQMSVTGYGVRGTADGGALISGCRSTFVSSYGCLLLKVAADGTREWDRYYTRTGDCRDARQTADGGYVVTGTADDRVLLLKVDAQGQVEWGRKYGAAATGTAVLAASDGGYLVAGGSGGRLALVRTDAAGDAATCDETADLTSQPAGLQAGDNPNDQPLAVTDQALPATPTGGAAAPAREGCTCALTASLQASPSPVCDFGDWCYLTASSVPTGCTGAVEYLFLGDDGYRSDWSTERTARHGLQQTTSFTVLARCADQGCQAISAEQTVGFSRAMVLYPGWHSSCPGETVTLGASPTVFGGTPPFDYSWTSQPPDPTLSCTRGPSCSNPTASPVSTTTYNLRVTDAVGCAQSGQAGVVVRGPLPPPEPRNLYMVKTVAATPPDATSIEFSWWVGGAVAATNLRASSNRDFAPPRPVVATVPERWNTTLAGEVGTPPALRLYRVTTTNCEGDESPI